MKERLESEMLHTISMAESDAHWLKEGKEMLVNGRMFDVKSFQQSSDGKVIVSGLYDDDETALVKAVRDTQQKDNNTSGKLLAQLFQFLGSINNSLNSDIFIFSLSNNSYFPGLEQRLTSQFITILSPPPQV